MHILHSKQQVLNAETKHEDGTDFIQKPGKYIDLESAPSQVAVTSVSGAKPEKLLSTVAAVRGGRTSSKFKGRGEASEEYDTDQFQSQEPVKRIGGFRTGRVRRTSQAAALLFKSLQKRRKKSMVKSTVASPEAGAESGARYGEEVAIPYEHKVHETIAKRTHRRTRRSLFGHRRKPPKQDPDIKRPKLGRNRTKRVFYTYVAEPNSASETADGNEQQPQSHNITPLAGELSSFSELAEQSSNSSAATPSGRSSRVIKVPKRFLDEEIIPFPKGSLTTWLKSQVREEEKPGPSCHESSYGENFLQSESDAVCVGEGNSAAQKFSTKPSSGRSHVEIYKNLKKLTLKLAEKKRSQSDIQGDQSDDGSSFSTTHVKRRRRSTLTMEEMDSPGVVRKLAVMVNTGAETPSLVASGDTENNSKKRFLFAPFFLLPF